MSQTVSVEMLRQSLLSLLRGVLVLVDGAHAMGALPISLRCVCVFWVSKNEVNFLGILVQIFILPIVINGSVALRSVLHA